MTFLEARNSIVAGLEQHIRCPVILSEQIATMPLFPYCYYSVLAPRITAHAFGLKEVLGNEEQGYHLKRSEPVEATMSFTFCSQNRETEDGGYIYGEDEALEVSEKAHGFFLLSGHNIQTDEGDIVVRNVGHMSSRSSFFVEDTVRRYGFDVRFVYIRTDEMPVVTIKHPGNPHGYYNRKKEESPSWQKT